MRILSKKKLKEIYLSQLAIQLTAFALYSNEAIGDRYYEYLINNSLHTVAEAGGMKMVDKLRKELDSIIGGQTNETQEF